MTAVQLGPPMPPFQVHLDDYPQTRTVRFGDETGALPLLAGLRAMGARYSLWQWFEGRLLCVEAGGPQGWHRLPGRPVEDGPGAVRRFLHAIKAEPGMLPAAPPGAPCGTGRADASFRVHDEAHTCLRCGADPIGVAAVADTDAGPRWVDMCHRCCNWLRAGSAAAEAEEFTARLDRMWASGTAAEADQLWRELWHDLGSQP